MVQKWWVLRHYNMDVLTAATIYYRCVYAQAQDSKAQLIELAQMLANPTPIQNPDANNIRTAFMSTLQQEVNNMELQDSYPITRPESKSEVRSMYNLVKTFYENLTKPTDQTLQLDSAQKKSQISNLMSDFQKVVNAWSDYSSKYFDGLIDQLNMDKSKADQTQQQDFQNRILFWQALTQRTSKTIQDIQSLLNDQLVGNPNNPLQTPLQATPV
jgi:hypothetical protein